MEENEKLPEYNPLRKCPKCGNEYPIWKLFFDSLQKRWRVGHGFCPASTPDGGIVDLCSACKMKDLDERRRKERS